MLQILTAISLSPNIPSRSIPDNERKKRFRLMSCVYSFVGDIISQKAIFVKGFFEITEENGAVFITAPYYYL